MTQAVARLEMATGVVETITETGCQRVEGCGCEVEAVSGTNGVLYWVPLAACPEHCLCIRCRQIRARLIAWEGEQVRRRANGEWV
jgi:hypothetical protein